VQILIGWSYTCCTASDSIVQQQSANIGPHWPARGFAPAWSSDCLYMHEKSNDLLTLQLDTEKKNAGF